METWPICYLRPRSVGLPHLAPRNMVGPPSIIGVEQVLASRAMMWTATLEQIRLWGRDQILAYRAIAARRQGRLVPMLVPFLEGLKRPLPVGYTGPVAQLPFGDLQYFSDGTGFSQWSISAKASAGSMGDTQFTVTMNTGGTLEPGMLFSIGERLYEITGVLAQPFNTWIIKFLPPLRQDHPDNAEMNFDQPVCRMRLASDNEMATSLDLTKRAEPSVSFLEDASTAPVIGAGSATPTVTLWTPLALGAKLRAWWNADDYVVTSGGQAQWKDRKSNILATQGVAAAQPQVIGGFVVADGIDDVMTASSGLTNLPSGSSNKAIVSLVDQTALIADATARRSFAYGDTGAAQAADVFRSVVAGVNRYMGLADPAADYSSVNIVAYVTRSNTTFRRINGTQSATTGTTTPAIVNTRVRHFANISATPSSFWQGGKRHEFVIADPTDLELQKLEGWIAWENSLQYLLPSNHPYKTLPPIV